MKLPYAACSLRGQELRLSSLAGWGTAAYLPGVKLGLDLGLLLPRAHQAEVVALTHGHADHMGALFQHILFRRMSGLRPATYLVPAPAFEGFQTMLQGQALLMGKEPPAVLRAIELDERVPLRKGWWIEPFPCVHRVPTYGYLVGHARQEEPALAFCGDTTTQVLHDVPRLAEAHTLVMECTFLGPEVSQERAAELGHAHLDLLPRDPQAWPQKRVIFSHPSARYSPREVAERYRGALPAELLAKVWAIHGGRFAPGMGPDDDEPQL